MTLAEKLALELAALVGEMSAIVEWCAHNDGECLADNPRQLAYARRVLEKARSRLKEWSPDFDPAEHAVIEQIDQAIEGVKP